MGSATGIPVIRIIFYVAAANATDRSRAQADFLCDGINDHVEIQAALDALPAGGGAVALSEGTFNIEVTVNVDSNQTLKGCGRNTILTTTTLVFWNILGATGALGTELTGIVIADLCVDGTAGGADGINMIFFTYVNNSEVRNVWAMNGIGGHGIRLEHSNSNRIIGNHAEGNVYGIYLNDGSSYNTVTGNIVQYSTSDGIFLDDGSCYNVVSSNLSAHNSWGNGIGVHNNSDHNEISHNEIVANDYIGILVSNSFFNSISVNHTELNGQTGIWLIGSDNNEVIGNHCSKDSQETTNTFYEIEISDSSWYNHVEGNTCRAGGLVKVPKYGIYIPDATVIKTVISENDLYDDGWGTAALSDAGLLTHVEDNNRGIHIDQIKMFRLMKNTSAAQRVAGDVVSLKAVAAGNEVTAPAAVGERQVYGMVAETINDAAWGLVQVKGKTTALKGTNAGGGNIVIGDNLITENGVRARKAAAATDPIFARALEALAAADGVIDAYIVSPWD